MKEELYDYLPEEKEESIDYQAIFFKYIIRWPWFVASVLLCLAGAWIYLRYTTPVYNISSTIIVKDDKKGGNASSNLTAFEDMGLLASSRNIDNEIEILRSKSLAKDVVKDLELYINYFAKNNFRDVELYNESPVLVHFTPEDADQLSEPMLLTINILQGGKIEVTGNINQQSVSRRFDQLPATLPNEAGTLTFLPNPEVALTDEGCINVTLHRPLDVAKNYAGNLTIEPTSKTTSVATISLKDTNRKRGESFIKKLIEMYNQDANDDKNEVAENTARFIDERIAVINKELGTTEEELESFKRDAGLTDLNSNAALAVNEKSEYEKLCVENGIQLSLIKYLSDYLHNPDNANNLLPVNTGLNDASLTQQINQYNLLVLERSRLLRSSSETNPAIMKLASNIRDVREGLATTIAGVNKGLLITKADLNRQANKFAGRINNAPTQERQFISIQRQQEIKAGLYLMLLQKREENNITLAATANNAKIIDDALADEAPVSPKRKLIYLISFVIGIGIPIAVIYLRNLLSFRIEGRVDVEQLTTVSIIGDVPLVQDRDEQSRAIVIQENENGLMAETFRNLRTNLLFTLNAAEQKVILVTSTVNSEGKTFITSNLAASLALLGKKVIVIGLDIRKPGLNKVFQLPNKEKGITQYLSAQSSDLLSLVQPSNVIPNLYVLPSGAIPPNPTELLARSALDDAIRTLRQEFDYILLDTAPIGMVTDTQIIARVADACIYVCRADYTHKTDFQLINELNKHGRLPNLCTVINGLDMKKKKYGYYYGYGKYGKYYGYGKKYGYGYGYGHQPESKK